MQENPLRVLQSFGQSVWLDFISRDIIRNGTLRRLIEEDGISGVTSNPSIFEKAISGSTAYDEVIKTMAVAGKSIDDIYQALTIEDIRMGADLLRPCYDRLQGADGYISLEVSPHLAHDTEGTIAEARRLWQAVDRPNLFIKVPGTREGVPAIRQLLSEGLNINITLLFSIQRYLEVAEAYMQALEDRLSRLEPIDHIASVASFFLSRIDVLIDPQLEQLENMPEYALSETAAMLKGEVAIASAKVAYRHYQEMIDSGRWHCLTELDARPQRLLWASTSTKNPAYSDVKYVEPLIGPDTVNTMPLETIDAYRDHGKPAPRLTENVEEAFGMLKSLADVGINLDQVTQQLEDEGVEKFDKPYEQLLEALAKKCAEITGKSGGQQAA